MSKKRDRTAYWVWTALAAVSVAVTAVVVPAAEASTPVTCRAVDGKADARCTPGALNPGVTQANIGQTICHPGWTATVRPPAGYTNQLKAQQMPAYGLAGLAPKDVEEDHLEPLELGGAPRDPRNLWPEAWNGPTGAHHKDADENRLHRAVCDHSMTLEAAQRSMIENWAHR